MYRKPKRGRNCGAVRLGAGTQHISSEFATTAKLNDVEPFAYLKDVLERMSNGHPMSKLDDLLPWNWTLSNPQSTTDV
jgi:hypothetical protein